MYTIEGELVHTAENVRDGERAWDLLTINGFKARSGIYLISVSDGRSTVTRKIAVIR